MAASFSFRRCLSSIKRKLLHDKSTRRLKCQGWREKKKMGFSSLSGNNLNLLRKRSARTLHIHTREGKRESGGQTQFCSRRRRKPRSRSPTFAWRRAINLIVRWWMNRSVFLKYLFAISLSPFLIVVSPLSAPRAFISFLYTSRYMRSFVSPVNSFVIRHFLCRSLRHCITSVCAFTRSFFFVSYYITDSLPAFSLVALPRSSLCILAIGLSFSWLSSRIVFSFLRENEGCIICIGRFCNISAGSHISMCRALKLCSQLHVPGSHKHIGDVDDALG